MFLCYTHLNIQTKTVLAALLFLTVNGDLRYTLHRAELPELRNKPGHEIYELLQREHQS